MSAGWVAASVRARAMARRRLGLVGVRRLHDAGSLAAAQGLLVETAYARSASADGLAAAQRAVAASVLWQVRVLAGWMPSSGTRIARTVVAAFERENLVDHLGAVSSRGSPGLRGSCGPGRAGPAAAPPFELGSLSTVWNRARTAPDPVALQAELAASPWGEIPVDDVAAFRDATAAAWFDRLAAEAPGAGPTAVAGAVLLVARCQVLEGRRLAPSAAAALDPLIGPRWPGATTVDELRAALDPPARRVLDGVTGGEQLWLAEAAAWQHLADTGARLLRDPSAGPERVVGAIAVLAADAFRVRAALADAAAGGGGEVLGGVA